MLERTKLQQITSAFKIALSFRNLVPIFSDDFREGPPDPFYDIFGIGLADVDGDGHGHVEMWVHDEIGRSADRAAVVAGESVALSVKVDSPADAVVCVFSCIGFHSCPEEIDSFRFQFGGCDMGEGETDQVISSGKKSTTCPFVAVVRIRGYHWLAVDHVVEGDSPRYLFLSLVGHGLGHARRSKDMGIHLVKEFFF